MKRVMNISERRAWTAALRSGSWEQGKGALRIVDFEFNTYCCLGVAQCVLGKQLPSRYSKMLSSGRFGLSYKLQRALTFANDGARDQCEMKAIFEDAGYSTVPKTNKRCRSSFSQIADWIDANL